MALAYISPRRYRNASRYGIYNQILNNVSNITYLESFNKTYISNDNSILHIVEPSEEGRLDIISNKFYGTPDRYWAIAIANNIIDPMVVIQGTVLQIPSFESLFETGGPLIRRT